MAFELSPGVKNEKPTSRAGRIVTSKENQCKGKNLVFEKMTKRNMCLGNTRSESRQGKSLDFIPRAAGGLWIYG